MAEDITMQDIKDFWQEEQAKAHQAMGDQLMAAMAGNQNCVQQAIRTLQEVGFANAVVINASAPRLPKAGETWRFEGKNYQIEKHNVERLTWFDSRWTFVSGPGDARPPGMMTPESIARGKALIARLAAKSTVRPLCERGPSAVAAAQVREPWRPSVDDDHWIPDAQEGRRR